MSSPSKNKGTTAETAVVRWAREHGFPWAERLTLAGSADCGDISLLPGRVVIIEVKNVRQAAAGQPPAALLTRWLAETAAECENAGADHALLVAKRAGTTDPGRWWCWMTMSDLSALLRTSMIAPDLDAPVCLDLAAAVRLLRAAGYGHPLTEGDQA